MSAARRTGLQGVRVWGEASLVVWLAASANGCTSNPGRPARSSLGCAQAVIEQRLPPHLGDKLTHCTAGALIARYCSPLEARMAGVAKEIRDAFTGGDVERADLQATLTGVHCASVDTDIAAIEACCAQTCAVCSRDTASPGTTP
jgi:hypothetical protein